MTNFSRRWPPRSTASVTAPARLPPPARRLLATLTYSSRRSRSPCGQCRRCRRLRTGGRGSGAEGGRPGNRSPCCGHARRRHAARRHLGADHPRHRPLIANGECWRRGHLGRTRQGRRGARAARPDRSCFTPSDRSRDRAPGESSRMDMPPGDRCPHQSPPAAAPPHSATAEPAHRTRLTPQPASGHNHRGRRSRRRVHPPTTHDVEIDRRSPAAAASRGEPADPILSPKDRPGQPATARSGAGGHRQGDSRLRVCSWAGTPSWVPCRRLCKHR